MGARKLTIVVAAFAACAGPAPRVVAVQATPAGAGYRATAVVENAGGGRGEVEVTLRLVDGAGHRFEHAEKLELDAHERKDLAALIWAPPGDYRVEGQARYPVP